MRLCKAFLATFVVLVSITKVSLMILLAMAASTHNTASAVQAGLPSHREVADETGHLVTGLLKATLARGINTPNSPGNGHLKSKGTPQSKPDSPTISTDVLDDPQPVLAASTVNSAPSPNLAAPAATGNFEGLHTTVDCTVPPDSDGAVGPTYYVAFVNNFNNCATQTPSGNVGFFAKSNGSLMAAFYYPNLFTGLNTSCNDPTQPTDPQVVYDSAEDHYFFAMVTTTAPFRMCLAVTLSNDPINGLYCAASYATQTSNLPDYDKAGVWTDGFYVSYNPSPSDSRTVVFNKADLEACNSIRTQDFDMGKDTRESDNFCTPQPNHIFRPVPASYNIFTGGVPSAGEPEFLVATYCLSGHVYVFTLHLDWSNSANSVLTRSLIAVQTTHFAPNTVASPANPVDTLNLHLMTPLNYIKDTNGNEYVWTTMTVCNGTSCSASSGLSAIAWYQLKVLNGNAGGTTVQDQNIWNPDSTSRLQAAGAFDRQGNVLMEYTQVSSSQNPAVAYAGRLASDPANTLGQTETILFRGSSMGSGACNNNPCVRWGDYSANSIDPDGCTFWFTHEYYSVSDPWQWDTRIGATKYASCNPLTYSKTTSPSSLSFASSGVGIPTLAENVTVTETGTGPLVVQSANLTGTNLNDFNILSDNCSTAPAGISSSTSCTIQLSCTPSASGTRTANLNIRTNVAAGDRTVVSLSCSTALLTSASVLCSPSTVPIGHSTSCSATVTDAAPGTSTPSGTVSFTSSVATSTFSATICTLIGSTATATCSVSYTQTASLTVPTITASYAGDSTHTASSGTTTLTIFLEGDVNGDCKVNIIDLTTVGIAFTSTPSSPNWNPAADLNHDGVVNIVDLVIVASNFNLAC